MLAVLPRSSAGGDAELRRLQHLLANPGWGASEQAEARRLLGELPATASRARALRQAAEARLSGSEGRPAVVVAESGRPGWADMAVVSEVKTWTYEKYTRVVVYVDRPIRFEGRELPADPVHDKPPRIYLDLEGARLDPKIPGELPIGDGLLTRARIAQFDPQRARLVLDLESLASYQIVPFREPFRLVIDVRGEGHAAAGAARRPTAPKVQVGAPAQAPDVDELAAILGGRDPAPAAATPPKPKAPAKAAEIRKPPARPVVVIDPGHGGKDPGAIGVGGIQEKAIVLRTSTRVAERLRARNYRVVMTRSDDRFLSLEERTIVANRENADLFVSIHANAAANPQAHGVETYHLARATDRRSAEVAARENATTQSDVDALEELLSALRFTSKQNVSSVLAKFVQDSIVGRLAPRYKPFRAIGVKGAPFYVLIGTDMAAVLVEIGFVTNPMESKRLQDSKYLDDLAAGIVEGIEEYLKAAARIPI